MKRYIGVLVDAEHQKELINAIIGSVPTAEIASVKNAFSDLEAAEAGHRGRKPSNGSTRPRIGGGK